MGVSSFLNRRGPPVKASTCSLSRASGGSSPEITWALEFQRRPLYRIACGIPPVNFYLMRVSASFTRGLGQRKPQKI